MSDVRCRYKIINPKSINIKLYTLGHQTMLLLFVINFFYGVNGADIPTQRLNDTDNKHLDLV